MTVWNHAEALAIAHKHATAAPAIWPYSLHLGHSPYFWLNSFLEKVTQNMEKPKLIRLAAIRSGGVANAIFNIKNFK